MATQSLTVPQLCHSERGSEATESKNRVAKAPGRGFSTRSFDSAAYGGCAQDAREVIQYLCEDFVEMEPHDAYNFCCGGGGGFIPMAGPFKERRLKSGKVKAEQIRATGASICITPCHNCYDQLRDLNKEYELGIKVLSFKEMFEEALIIPEDLKAKDEDDQEE